MAGRQPAHLPRRLAASAVVARRVGRVPPPKQQGAAGAGRCGNLVIEGTGDGVEPDRAAGGGGPSGDEDDEAYE